MQSGKLGFGGTGSAYSPPVLFPKYMIYPENLAKAVRRQLLNSPPPFCSACLGLSREVFIQPSFPATTNRREMKIHVTSSAYVQCQHERK